MRTGSIIGLFLTTVFTIAPRSAPTHEVTVERNVAAPMRDGVLLRADVYRPSGAGRYPILLQRTPYSKRTERSEPGFRFLASRGFVVVVQDTRGRYMSDGVAVPHDEAQDGVDTVAWVRTLPYGNGKVGMFGGSYLATTQLLAATLRPQGLLALFPSGSYNSRYDMVFQGGAFYLNDGLSWSLGQAADVRRRTFTPDVVRDGEIGLTADERRAFAERWLWHVPLKSMDVLELHRFSPGYMDLLNHPSYGPFWDRFNIEARYGEFQVPALHLTGWYDTLLNGTLRNFTGLRAHAGTEQARRFQKLIVGPWTHSDPTPQSTRIGDVDFGPAAGISGRELGANWFDYWLAGPESASAEAQAMVEGPPVRIFVMGENKWRNEQEWPIARARTTDYFLHSSGSANSLRGDGRLSQRRPASAETADQFTYDPWNPVPTGPLGAYSRMPSDQRAVEARDDVLVYTSDPIVEPLEVTGPISLKLWVASSAPDTDFTGKLIDVLPDGTARALTDGILRLRYRSSRTTPTLAAPNQPLEITIDLGATSNAFLNGHRIRLEVSSSNFPRFDRNPNTGGVFAEDSELRRAQQRILHDAAHPSRLLLPIVPR
jgi:uncharacterized protein